MKLYTASKAISSICLFVLASTAFAGHAGMMGPTAASGKFYVGVFGGGGASDQIDVNQYGTAFYPEASGGPLAVNAFGHTSSRSVWLAGAQIGYQAQEISLDPRFQWALVPAAELEGYYIGHRSFTGDLTNNTSRLPEHDFAVTYPMESGVFLTNAVLSFSNPCYLFHPYIGFGIGGAIVRISGADATQLAPPEAGVNHYNSNTTDTSPTFAGQIKLGLSYDINPCISVFAEYRWLYLSSTHFAFGSTVYPAHPETSNWQVNLESQNYNMGTAGIRFKF